MAVYDRLTAENASVLAMFQDRRPQSRHFMRISLYLGLAAADTAALLLGPLIANAILHLAGVDRSALMAAAALLPVFMIVAINNGAISQAALEHGLESVRRSLAAYATAVALVVVIAFALKRGDDISRLGFCFSVLCSIVLLVALRGSFRQATKKLTRLGLGRSLLIVDERPIPEHADNDIVVDARFASLRPDLNDPLMLDRFGRLAGTFDRVIVASPPERHRSWALMLKGLDVDGEIMMDGSNAIDAIGIRSHAGMETLVVAHRPLTLADRAKKRLLDIAVTVPLLIALTPLLALIAILIKLDSPGPVLFRQLRVGRGSQLFEVLKFRSMRVESTDSDGGRSASRDDDRITRVGRFIRATSIDELPQLFNVLLGDMSLVGPRPHALGSLADNRLFWQIDETYWHRHRLKPGITGLAQIRGFRGATIECSDLTNRLAADKEYIQDWDIWQDIAILLKTAGVVVHRNAF